MNQQDEYAKIVCPGCGRRLWKRQDAPMPGITPTPILDARGLLVARATGRYNAGNGSLRQEIIKAYAIGCGSERCRQKVLLRDREWPLRVSPIK